MEGMRIAGMADATAAPTDAITVSVVMATYNRAAYIAEALHSLLEQTCPPLEVIVVDDGSTDATASVVAEFGARVRYVKMAENSGKPTAVNFGIALARGSHLLIFDDDDVALPDALQSHVEFLDAHPEIDFTYSSNHYSSAQPDIWYSQGWTTAHVPAWAADEFFIQRAAHMQAMMQGMLIPKRCFDVVGCFDVALLRSQDDDMVLRLARRFCAANLGKPTFVLRQHNGVRGPQGAKHSVAQRAAVWLHYGRMIYRKARSQLPLRAWLPHTPGEEVDIEGDIERGRALLQRGAIMLRHGLTDEAVVDLRAALMLLRQAGAASRWTQQVLSSAFDVDAWELAKPLACAFWLRALPTNARPSMAIAAIARGIYWALRRALRQHHWGDALRSSAMLVILCLPFPGLNFLQEGMPAMLP